WKHHLERAALVRLFVDHLVDGAHPAFFDAANDAVASVEQGAGGEGMLHAVAPAQGPAGERATRRRPEIRSRPAFHRCIERATRQADWPTLSPPSSTMRGRYQETNRRSTVAHRLPRGPPSGLASSVVTRGTEVTPTKDT